MAQGCRLSYKRYEYSLEKLYKKKIIGETSLCQYAWKLKGQVKVHRPGLHKIKAKEPSKGGRSILFLEICQGSHNNPSDI